MSTCCNGANIATGKRKRGRPPGMKNKPRFPAAATSPHAGAATLHPHILEIPAGGDVAETIAAFARGCRIFGVCVLSASGRIAVAVLWEATPYPSTVTFQGSFDLLSITATFLPGRSEGSTLAVTLAGPQGQVIGGVVAGPVVAAGKVIVVAATFTSPAAISFSSQADTCRSEKSNAEEVEQGIVLSPAVDGDGGSEEKSGLDAAVYENYLIELERCLELPAEVGGGGAANGFGAGEAEDKWEGNFFEEHYPDLQQMVVDGAFEGSEEYSGELFAMDAFTVSDGGFPLY